MTSLNSKTPGHKIIVSGPNQELHNLGACVRNCRRLLLAITAVSTAEQSQGESQGESRGERWVLTLDGQRSAASSVDWSITRKTRRQHRSYGEALAAYLSVHQLKNAASTNKLGCKHARRATLEQSPIATLQTSEKFTHSQLRRPRYITSNGSLVMPQHGAPAHHCP